MSAPYNPATGVVFESVSFTGDLLNITFSEPHNRGEGVMVLNTLVLDAARKTPVEFAEFMESLQTLVDAGERALRNPPEHRHPSQ